MVAFEEGEAIAGLECGHQYHTECFERFFLYFFSFFLFSFFPLFGVWTSVPHRVLRKMVFFPFCLLSSCFLYLEERPSAVRSVDTAVRSVDMSTILSNSKVCVCVCVCV